MTKEILQQIIDLADKNARPQLSEMWESANLALSDAIFLQSVGRLEDASKRAISSLKYSVGIFHPDYAKAVELSNLTK